MGFGQQVFTGCLVLPFAGYRVPAYGKSVTRGDRYLIDQKNRQLGSSASNAILNFHLRPNEHRYARN